MRIISCITVMVVIACLTLSIYVIDGDMWQTLSAWLDAEALGGRFDRDIGTNRDLWLNGYLGIFFRVKMFGGLNWLALPLFTHFLFTIRKKHRWEIALAMVVVLSTVFICLQGYANFRYQLTIFPMLITLIFLYGGNFTGKLHIKFVSIIGVTCLLVLTIAFYPIGKKYWSYWASGKIYEKFEQLDPHRMINYIEKDIYLEDDSVILECNQPLLYYHTSKKGLSYVDRKVRVVYRMKKNPQRAYEVLKEKLKVRYVLAREPFDCYSDHIINTYCQLILDDQGFKLYKLRDSSEIMKL